MNEKNIGREKYRVGIFGSYGYWNQGDEAILASIIAQLRQSLPVEIVVFTQDAQVTNRLHRVERAVPVAELTRNELAPELERLDLLIIGGGGILFDQWVQQHFGVEALAVESGVPIMFYGVGAGPLEDLPAQKQVRKAIEKAKAVTVRDRSSKQVLEKAGVGREILVTGDPAVLLEPEPLPQGTLRGEGIQLNHPLVGISLREPGPAAPGLDEERYHSLIASAADFIVARYGANLLYVPMEPKSLDLQHSHAVIAKMRYPEHATVLQGEYKPQQVLSLMQHLTFAIGMRLHFLIFAALQKVPFVPLPYASKVSSFIEAMGLEMPELDKISIGQFLAYIDRIWDHQEAVRERIDNALPPLQEDARKNNAIAVALLKQGEAGEPSSSL